MGELLIFKVFRASGLRFCGYSFEEPGANKALALPDHRDMGIGAEKTNRLANLVGLSLSSLSVKRLRMRRNQ